MKELMRCAILTYERRFGVAPKSIALSTADLDELWLELGYTPYSRKHCGQILNFYGKPVIEDAAMENGRVGLRLHGC